MSGDDWVKVIGALASAIVAVAAGLAGIYLQVRRTHQLVNSRMEELLELTRASARAAGRLEVLTDPALVTTPLPK